MQYYFLYDLDSWWIDYDKFCYLIEFKKKRWEPQKKKL